MTIKVECNVKSPNLWKRGVWTLFWRKSCRFEPGEDEWMMAELCCPVSFYSSINPGFWSFNMLWLNWAISHTHTHSHYTIYQVHWHIFNSSYWIWSLSLSNCLLLTVSLDQCRIIVSCDYSHLNMNLLLFWHDNNLLCEMYMIFLLFECPVCLWWNSWLWILSS